MSFHASAITSNHTYFPFLALAGHNYNKSQLENMGIKVGSQTGDIISLRIPASLFSELTSLPGIKYIEKARSISPMLNRAIPDTRVDSVWQGLNLPMPFSGKNVLIGITDWGFDYTHPMFYDTLLQHTRIEKVWDQYRNSGTPPAGYSYGAEYSGEMSLLQAQSDTFNIYEYAYHGSHVAGIAGGSGAGTKYRGVAYDAGFLFATFLVDEAAVLDAFAWMKEYAEDQGKRLVINMSWGLYYFGTLDGTSLISQAINQMSSEGVVFVTSAGNNGNGYFHMKHNFIGDTLRTVIGFDNYSWYPEMWGQSVSMWGQPGNPFSFSLKILNTSNVQLDETPFFITASAAAFYEDTLLIGSDTIIYNFTADSAHPLNNRPHFRLRVRNLNTSLYKIALYVSAPSSTVHFWNVIELNNGVGNWGLPFEAPLTGWQQGDYYYGIGEPACTESVISVAAYLSEFKLTNGTMAGGTIAYFSSYGPTLDDRLKPDISAPGQNVISSISSFTNASISPVSVVETVQFNGRDYKFVSLSGTSMSSPMVAGIVALMLEANPWLSAAEVKNIIRLTAREDNRTGNIPDTGSIRWGWGKINALHAIKTALTGISQNQADVSPYTIYPNPATSEVYIFNEPGFSPDYVNIFSASGHLITKIMLSGGNKIIIDFLPSGFYIMEVCDVRSKISLKLLKSY